MKFTKRTYAVALKRAQQEFDEEFKPEYRFDLDRAAKAANFIGKVLDRAYREGKLR